MTHPQGLPKNIWRLVLAWLAILLLAVAPALAETLEVQRPNTHVFESPSFGSPSLGEVPVGEQVEVKSRSGEWVEVEIDCETGWIHQMAFPQAPVQLPPLHTEAPVPEPTTEEVALAGKGFTPEVETDYREKNPELNYAQVDQIEAFRISPSQVTGFLQAGQLLTVPGGAAASGEFSAADEYYLGRAVAANILAKYPLYQNQALSRHVNLVGQAVAQKYRSATSRGFHFAVLDASEPNAFACPGGIILVTRGLIKSCQNEDELAAVLAHEVGHVVHHDGLQSISTAKKTEKSTHAALQPLKAAKLLGAVRPGIRKRLKRQMAAKGAKTAVSSVAGSVAAGSLVDLFEDSINDAVKTIMVNGYSRGAEKDADREAVSLLTCTGYNPMALTAFLDHLASSGSGSSGMFRTHPSTSSRVARVKSLVVQAQANPGEQTRTSRFQQAAL